MVGRHHVGILPYHLKVRMYLHNFHTDRKCVCSKTYLFILVRMFHVVDGGCCTCHLNSVVVSARQVHERPIPPLCRRPGDVVCGGMYIDSGDKYPRDMCLPPPVQLCSNTCTYALPCNHPALYIVYSVAAAHDDTDARTTLMLMCG